MSASASVATDSLLWLERETVRRVTLAAGGHQRSGSVYLGALTVARESDGTSLACYATDGKRAHVAGKLEGSSVIATVPVRSIEALEHATAGGARATRYAVRPSELGSQGAITSGDHGVSFPHPDMLGPTPELITGYRESARLDSVRTIVTAAAWRKLIPADGVLYLATRATGPDGVQLAGEPVKLDDGGGMTRAAAAAAALAARGGADGGADGGAGVAVYVPYLRDAWRHVAPGSRDKAAVLLPRDPHKPLVIESADGTRWALIMGRSSL